MDFSNVEVTIDHIADAGAKIKAYATVTFDGSFQVHGVRLAESKKGLNIFMPQRVYEKDGKKLWEFTVEEVVNDKAKNTAYLKGIKGKVYRADGSFIDISADKGSAGMKSNDFFLEGNIKAVLNTGGELYADKISWNQEKELITATGHFKMHKDAYTATADSAVTTSAFKHIKLKGNAKVEKGGE